MPIQRSPSTASLHIRSLFTYYHLFLSAEFSSLFSFSDAFLSSKESDIKLGRVILCNATMRSHRLGSNPKSLFNLKLRNPKSDSTRNKSDLGNKNQKQFKTPEDLTSSDKQ